MRDRLDNNMEKIFILFHFTINLEINIVYSIFAILYLFKINFKFVSFIVSYKFFCDSLIIVFHYIVYIIVNIILF